MNPKVKAKWLKALRSGEYDQTESTLLERTPEGDKFCCLGVLCNLYAQEHPGTGFRKEDMSFFNEIYNLPPEVADWAAIVYEQVSDTCTPVGVHLAVMNDDDKKNFNEIANWIEKNL